jgi:uncharacterized alkaline shock family protein YloU
VSAGYEIRGAGGSISVAPSLLPAIVQRAAETVEGARVRRRRRGVDVHVEGGAVRVDIGLAAAYGAVLPDVARTVQERVAAALSDMSGLEVAAVDVTIEELVGA